MSMAHGLEVRSPFLDAELLRYTTGLPPRLKAARTLAEARPAGRCTDLCPPRSCAGPKRGFGVPLDRWFRQDLRSYCLCARLAAPDARVKEHLVPEALNRLLAEHDSGIRNHGHALWTLFDTGGFPAAAGMVTYRPREPRPGAPRWAIPLMNGLNVQMTRARPRIAPTLEARQDSLLTFTSCFSISQIGISSSSSAFSAYCLQARACCTWLLAKLERSREGLLLVVPLFAAFGCAARCGHRGRSAVNSPKPARRRRARPS